MTSAQRLQLHTTSDNDDGDTFKFMADENFGDRPQKLVAAFARLDKLGARKLPTPMIEKLLTKFPDACLTPEELIEFKNEADSQGYISYDEFVKKVIFGKIK